MLTFSFAYPWLLLLLVAPTLLLTWVWKRRSGRVVVPFDYREARPGEFTACLLNVAESLPALLLAAVVILLAGPQRLSEPRSRRAMTNIEFCVDISGSMVAPFGGGTRYDASMKAISEFLDLRQGDAFGLTFFGNSVLHWCPLTSDPSALKLAPSFLTPNRAPPWFGGTEIGKALKACEAILTRREQGDRMIVLVSDGMSGDLSNDNDLEIARSLRRNGIAVYAIHIAESEVPGPITNITTLTGGAAFSPGDTEGLKGIFQRIDQMQQTELEKTAAELLDNFVPFCMAALALLGMALLASLGVRYTPW